MTLRIADGLELPDDVVTQPIAILARRGAGKTYTATVIVEEVIRERIPVVVLDPTGAWWGLRSSVDGEHPGLPVVIFGGDHGDVPLEATDGRAIADVALEHPGAFIVDLSAFESKRAEQRFAADFLERLYRGKKRETGPLLLVVDEADVFAPQRPMGDEQPRTLGALEAIVRRGRIKGLGDLLISQRAAVLNKNVLNMTEVLVAMQTTGPQDRAAIDDWISGNGSREERDAVLTSLASLERGEAWVWSPSFLRILQRVRIRARTTFDSSRTPDAGEAAVAPSAFADIDLDALGPRIVAAREKQKADDPKELHRRITALERQLAEKPVPSAPIIERVEVPVLNGQVDKLAGLLVDMRQHGESFVQIGDGMREIAASIATAIGRAQGQTAVAPARVPTVAPVREAPRPRPVVVPTDGAISLGKAERLILAALAQYPQGRSQTQVALLTGYANGGGGFNNALSRLRANGLAEGSRALLRITDAGTDAAGDVEPLPTGRALVDHWLAQLSKAERLILEALVSVYPDAMTKQELGDATGYAPDGGGFNNALSRLRTLELITRGELRASADLVDG